jgi:hypothetical protein
MNFNLAIKISRSFEIISIDIIIVRTSSPAKTNCLSLADISHYRRSSCVWLHVHVNLFTYSQIYSSLLPSLQMRFKFSYAFITLRRERFYPEYAPKYVTFFRSYDLLL